MLTAAAHAADAPNERMPLTHVAVLVFPTSPAAKLLAGSAQSRLEQILTDNGVQVTDRDDSSKIKGIWKKLEDPGYFVTADDFVKNTASYRLDGIVRVYLSADSAPAPGGFFSATAQADMRLVDEDAKVQAQVSFPMGAPGRPPSDGLTAQAALLNAMQRAIDEAAKSLNLEVAEPARLTAAPIIAEMKRAPIMAIRPTGEEVPLAVVVEPPPPAELAVVAAPVPVLPDTASQLPLIALFGLVALGGAFAMRIFAKRVQ